MSLSVPDYFGIVGCMNYLPHVTDVAESYDLDATLLNATLYAFVMNFTDKMTIDTPQGKIDIMELPENVIDLVGQEVADALFNNPSAAELVGFAMHQVSSSEFEWGVFDADVFANAVRVAVTRPELLTGLRYADEAQHAAKDLGWECEASVDNEYNVTVLLVCNT